MPLYQHDCQKCIYLGVDVSHEGEPSCNGVDLYVCESMLGGACLIRRYSSEGSNYGAMPDNYAGERYAEVRRRAIERGIIKEEKHSPLYDGKLD